jgi:small subunit ribosomal protein S16
VEEEKQSMAVTLRMTRTGNRNNPFFRIIVADSRSPRDGKFLETIGTYDPARSPAVVKLDMDRVAFWRSKGATMSETVSQLVKRHGKSEPK